MSTSAPGGGFWVLTYLSLLPPEGGRGCRRALELLSMEGWLTTCCASPGNLGGSFFKSAVLEVCDSPVPA